MKSFFISSTFRDMQEERDMIHRIVFPSVRNTLKKYQETAEEVDLRWGVDTLNLTEEESGHMVIRVCIDAIDRCVPYFIVLLGERYGWIPDQAVFEKMYDERLEQFPKDISITEMEIRYGTLTREVGLEQCIFCFRDESLISQIPLEYQKDYVAESQEHKEKLERLKKKIRNTKGANILDYDAQWDAKNQKVCGLETFAEQLEHMLIELLQKEGLSEDEMPEEERITRNAEFVMQQYLNTYVNRAKAEEMLPILYASKKNVWFSGKSGSGKTAFLSFAANQCRQKNMTSLIYYGGDPGCRSVDTFLSWLAYELEKICGKTLKTDNQTRRIAVKKIQNLSKLLTDTVLIFVDALDQMPKDTLWVLMQLIRTTTRLQFFVTSTEMLWDLGIQEAADMFASRKLELLTDTELELIVSKAAGRRGKSLDARVTKKIRAKGSMHLPIHLSLLLQRLFMMDGKEFQYAEKMAPGMEGISQYMQMLIDSAGDTSEDLVALVLNKTMEIMQSEGGAHVAEILGFIASAPNGISLRMLSELCPKVTMLQIQQLLCFLYDIVEETEDGRWVFKHRIYEKGICRLFGDAEILSYKEKLFEKYKEDRSFQWDEFIRLGKELKKEEIAGEIVSSVEAGALTEEQIWNIVRAEPAEENDYLLLAEKTQCERYSRIILHGIVCDAIEWSKESVRFLESADDNRWIEKETLFYLYGAKCRLYEFLSQADQEREYAEKQYQIYTQMEHTSKKITLEMLEACAEVCCSYDVKRAKLWYQRLTDVEKVFSKQYKDNNEFLLLNNLLLWYYRMLNYKESGSEEDLEELNKLFDAQHTIYKMQDSLNLYEQENPGHNEKCMQQIAVFARNLSGIYLKNKNYPKAYPYAKIAYDESKNVYQLNRTFETADIYSWTATNLMRCMKKGSDSRKTFHEEAKQALAWMEEQYFCPRVGECQRYLYVLDAEEENAIAMREQALAMSRRLREEFPLGDYDEMVLYDCRKYVDALNEKNEHNKFDKILASLQEIKKSADALYERTKDEYFLDLLHEWALNMMQTYTWQEMFEDAEHYLKKAEEYLACDFIQKGKMRWHREVLTAGNGIVLYYRSGDHEKLESYMQKIEILFTDENERNKNQSRRDSTILWSARILFMRARLLWDSMQDLDRARAMIEDYFTAYTGVVDENELRPARLLLGELEAAAGNAGKAIIEWKKARMRGEKNMGWDWECLLSEYEVWQYVIAAKASLLIYDVTKVKDPVYLNRGMKAFTNILAYHTRDKNAAYRKVAGKHLAEYFMKCRGVTDPSVEQSAAEILLIWMEHIAKERPLDKAEKDLIGECLICRMKFEASKPWEEETAYAWLLTQKQTYPNELRWNDRINRILIHKALKHCINEDYAQGIKACESIPGGDCVSWNLEKDVLLNICKIRTGSAAQLDLLETYIMEAAEKKKRETVGFWLYIEALIAVGTFLPEKEETYFREAAELLEKKVLERDEGTVKLWEKDYRLRNQCLEYSYGQLDKSEYIEDLKAARMAWAKATGSDKESISKLLEWDSRIAYAYEGVDEKLKWSRWEYIGRILISFIIKKDVLLTEELEQVIRFYHRLLDSVVEQPQFEYSMADMLLTLAYETMSRLYDLTEDVKWLDKILEALEVYRSCMNSPKLNENRSDFRNEKVAESYEYDMIVYRAYLECEAKEPAIEKLVNAGWQWIACIPKYYKELVTKAVGTLKEFDELLEGRSLEMKALIQALQMRREGDSNEIFWFIKGLYGKYGTNLSLEDLQELYRKELEKRVGEE